MSDVILGLGRATGMFYHAPAGTALPTSPTETLASAWEEVGYVSDAGITMALNKSATNIKNWANKVVRVILTDHSETVDTPLIETNEETMKVVVGASNVTTTAATSSHGKLVSVNLSDGELPPEEAFLWLMKDGDTAMGLGCTHGQVSAVANVSFAPSGAITWTPTITALEDGVKLITDDGQTTT